MVVDANRRLENVAWSDESRFLLQHSDDRVKIRHKEHESMDPSRFVSTVRAGAGGVMVWRIFSWYTFLSNNWVLFKRHSLPEYCCWPCPSLYDYSVLIFWCTSSRIMHNITKLKSSQTGFLNMTMSSLYSNGLHSYQISINRAALGCGGTGDSHHGYIYIHIYTGIYIYREREREREIMGLIPKEHA